MSEKIAIHWFRQDLRLKDNPALSHASLNNSVLPIYILDEINANKFKMGEASKWWLHHSLSDLNKSLDNKLSIYIGNPEEIITKLIQTYNIELITWNRCYEPWRIKRDSKLKKLFESMGIEVHSHNGSLLWEPWEVLKADGTPYKVFTPFYQRGCLAALPPRDPVNKPRSLKLIADNKHSIKLNKLNLLPNIGWDQEFYNLWDVSESGAHKRLSKFIANGLDNYKKGRDFPALLCTSRLSPYLHFGQLSPNQVWYKVKETRLSDNLKSFMSELGWREFSYSLLYHFPELPSKNWRDNFDKFPWKNNNKLLSQWQQGQTGYPIVDAGMRELWQTGYMHNRVRMIVGSFLVKNLLQDWRKGEAWFWDCLLDADLASNSASWQWVAGCGADAAPYFRIFNPTTQGQKFDPHGEYTKKFVPELSNLPDKYLYNPWEAPDEILKQSGIKLGVDYPMPIVDVKESRAKALAAFDAIKNK